MLVAKRESKAFAGAIYAVPQRVMMLLSCGTQVWSPGTEREGKRATLFQEEARRSEDVTVTMIRES